VEKYITLKWDNGLASNDKSSDTPATLPDLLDISGRPSLDPHSRCWPPHQSRCSTSKANPLMTLVDEKLGPSEERWKKSFPGHHQAAAQRTTSVKMSACFEISCKVFARRGNAPDSGAIRAFWFPVRRFERVRRNVCRYTWLAQSTQVLVRNTACSIKRLQEHESGLWKLH
jgi:hypothetical protein